MKISRKDLRRIILESLNEKTLLKEVNLSAMHKDFRQLKQALDEKDEEKETKFMRKIRKHHADLEYNKSKEKGPFRLESTDQRRKYAEDLLSDFAKVVNEDTPSELPDPPPPPAAAEEINITPAPQESEITSEPAQETETGPDWQQYRNETGWVYKLKQKGDHKIWVTKKADGSGPEYDLDNPLYAATVRRLDGTGPEGKPEYALQPPRSDADKAADAALKAAPARRSRDQSVGTAQASEDESGNSANVNLAIGQEVYAKWTDGSSYRAKITSIDAGSEEVTVAWLDSSGNETDHEQATVKIADLTPYTESSESSDAGESDEADLDQAILLVANLGQPYMGDFDSSEKIEKAIEFCSNRKPELKNKSKKELAISALGEITDVPRNILSQFIADRNYLGLLSHMNDNKIGFNLHGFDSSYDESFKKKLLNAISNALGANMSSLSSIPLNENKIVYGESHASLIRKRYWGRY